MKINHFLFSIIFLQLTHICHASKADNKFVNRILHRASNNKPLSPHQKLLIGMLNSDDVCALSIAVNNARMIADGSEKQLQANRVVQNLLNAGASVSRLCDPRIFGIQNPEAFFNPLKLALHESSVNSRLKEMLLAKK